MLIKRIKYNQFIHFYSTVCKWRIVNENRDTLQKDQVITQFSFNESHLWHYRDLVCISLCVCVACRYITLFDAISLTEWRVFSVSSCSRHQSSSSKVSMDSWWCGSSANTQEDMLGWIQLLNFIIAQFKNLHLSIPQKQTSV